jgi:hypothetical protein
LKAAVRLRGLAAVDARTAPAQAMLAHRRDLIASLGGDDAVSPQQRALVDMAVRLRLLADHGYAFLLAQKTLVTRRRAFIPLVREVTAVAESYTRILGQLGLERKKAPPLDLATYVERTYGNGKSATEPAATGTSATERVQAPGSEPPPSEGDA